MTLDRLIQKIDALVMSDKLPFFVVGVPLTYSFLGVYYSIDYASKGEHGNATIAGCCTLINAYYAGYQSKVLFQKKSGNE